MESHDAPLALQDQLWAWFETHKKHVVWGAAALVVVGCVISIVLSVKNAKEANANEALSKAISGEGAELEQVKSPEAFLEATAKTAANFLKVAADYPNTDAGVRAQLLGAGGLFAAEKYPEARAQFDRFLKEYRETPYASQAMFGAAACLQAQGQTNEAVAAYSDVIRRFPNDNVASRAKLALAQLYVEQNKLSQARDLYEELLQTSRNTSSLGTESYVHLRELMARHPELSPARPAATNSPVFNIGQP